MSDAVRVKVEGADTFARTLRSFSSELESLTRASEAAGRLVAQRAAGRAPKRSGALARSIRAVPEGSDVAIGSSLIYAGVIEGGWAAHGISPQPYLFPAGNDSLEMVTDIYAAETQAQLNKVRGA